MATNWSLEIARRNKGRHVYINDWVVEKLAKVVEGLTSAAELVNELNADSPLIWEEEVEVVFDSYRNALKLAAFIGGTEYSEEGAGRAFEGGSDAMRREFERALGALLRERR